MKKHLIISGCSFSETHSKHISWSENLVKMLPHHALTSKALGSQGNGLISRSIIYEVSKKLKNQVEPNNILVGVQWSGSDRMDFLVDDNQLDNLRLDRTRPLYDSNPKTNWDGWMENPTGFVDGQPKKWVIANLGWKLSKDYYMKWHSPTYGAVMTLEHILRTQWFLERNNINYFMTTMNSEVMLPTPSCRTDPEVMHLYNQIDLTKFLPIPGMAEWCYGDSEDIFRCHPTDNHHLLFAKDVIMPWLKKNIWN